MLPLVFVYCWQPTICLHDRELLPYAPSCLLLSTGSLKEGVGFITVLAQNLGIKCPVAVRSD